MFNASRAVTRYIDIHSHLIPDIDDGCRDIEEVVACVKQLKQQGFVGSICTPHIWPEMFPLNTPAKILGWTQWLRRELADRGVDYELWPGGEVRLYKDAIRWWKDHGVATLGGSNRVLVDMWVDAWPKWADQTIDHLLAEGYQPILAHPERINIHDGKLQPRLDALQSRGVWLQGNLQCFTGEQGYHADRYAREFLDAGRYQLLAMDMHRVESLEGRFDGMALIRRDFGRDVLEALLADAPRRLILDAAPGTGA